MDLAALFPPPPILQRRAWEATCVLFQDYRERLSEGQRQVCASMLRQGPERMDWDGIGAALRMYGRLVGTP